MADSRSSEARALVVLLGGLASRLMAFCREFQSDHHTEAVQWAVECKSYETGPVVEVWADITLRPGHAIVWWMDLLPGDDAWAIAGQVSINGQERLMTCEREDLAFEDLSGAAYATLEELLSFRAQLPNEA